MVSINRYHTADSAYADIVLPAATYYEITSYMRFGPMFKIRERLVEPQGEARNDFLILAELAGRLAMATFIQNRKRNSCAMPWTAAAFLWMR